MIVRMGWIAFLTALWVLCVVFAVGVEMRWWMTKRSGDAASQGLGAGLAMIFVGGAGVVLCLVTMLAALIAGYGWTGVAVASAPLWTLALGYAMSRYRYWHANLPRWIVIDPDAGRRVRVVAVLRRRDRWVPIDAFADARKPLDEWYAHVQRVHGLVIDANEARRPASWQGESPLSKFRKQPLQAMAIVLPAAGDVGSAETLATEWTAEGSASPDVRVAATVDEVDALVFEARSVRKRLTPRADGR